MLDLAAQSLAIDARPLVPGSRLARADKKGAQTTLELTGSVRLTPVVW